MGLVGFKKAKFRQISNRLVCRQITVLCVLCAQRNSLQRVMFVFVVTSISIEIDYIIYILWPHGEKFDRSIGFGHLCVFWFCLDSHMKSYTKQMHV